MRISDWSSDVCSSDLPARFQIHTYFQARINNIDGLRNSQATAFDIVVLHMQPGFQDGRTRAVEQQGNKMLWAGAKHLGFQAYIGIGLNRVRPSGPARGGIAPFSLPILPSMDNCWVTQLLTEFIREDGRASVRERGC